MRYDLSLIIPTYNARALTLKKIALLHEYLAQRLSSFEIVLVEDGCITGERVTQSELPSTTRLISLQVNRGKGFAVRTGMLEAQGACRVFTDIDLPYDLSAIPHSMELILGGGAHFVAGDRSHKCSILPAPPPFMRRLTSRVLQKIVYLIILGGIKDTQCGFKALSGTLAESLIPLLRIDRFGFDVEIFYLLDKYHIHIWRIPVLFHAGAASSVSPLRDGAKTALDLMSIPLNWYRGEYNSEALRQLEWSRYWERDAPSQKQP